MVTKNRILEDAYLDPNMRTAIRLVDVGVEADGKTEQVMFGIIKEHGKACASLACAPWSATRSFPSSTCASPNHTSLARDSSSVTWSCPSSTCAPSGYAPSASVSSSACSSSTCASSGCAPFNILKITGIMMAKEGLYTKVASLLSYQPRLFPAIALKHGDVPQELDTHIALLTSVIEGIEGDRPRLFPAIASKHGDVPRELDTHITLLTGVIEEIKDKEATLCPVLCVKRPRDEAPQAPITTFRAQSGWPKSGCFQIASSSNCKEEIMRKVRAISVRWPYGKAPNLDSDIGVRKHWEVEDNRVIKTRADAQDSGRRDECTLIELSGQPKTTTVPKSQQRTGIFNAAEVVFRGLGPGRRIARTDDMELAEHCYISVYLYIQAVWLEGHARLPRRYLIWN